MLAPTSSGVSGDGKTEIGAVLSLGERSRAIGRDAVKSRCPPESGHLISASRDYPFFMNRRTCSTGQSLLALITRTREPSA
jgi:hypothetical protein